MGERSNETYGGIGTEIPKICHILDLLAHLNITINFETYNINVHDLQGGPGLRR